MINNMLSLSFSPCPNDTFMFDAMIHHKVDTEGLSFDVSYDDIETLNQKAFQGVSDISKLSFHAFAYVVENYVLLNAGNALGFGVGPLLITSNQRLSHQALDEQLCVGIPGKYTTANFLLGIAYPQLKNKKELLFSKIETELLEKNIDLGVIIHENRFTYQEKGLYKIIDLGEYWEKETGAPIPLGGIVIKRSLPMDLKEKVQRVLKRSVTFALENPKSGIEFIRANAQEMSEEVMYKHIELYVNHFSVDLGKQGRNAVHELFSRAYQLDFVPKTNKTLFL